MNRLIPDHNISTIHVIELMLRDPLWIISHIDQYQRVKTYNGLCILYIQTIIHVYFIQMHTFDLMNFHSVCKCQMITSLHVLSWFQTDYSYFKLCACISSVYVCVYISIFHCILACFFFSSSLFCLFLPVYLCHALAKDYDANDSDLLNCSN